MRLNFAETLRQKPRSLPNPTQFGFDASVWHQAYLAQGDGTPEDHYVYLLGQALGHQAGRVQASVEHLSSGLAFRTIGELAGFFSARINEAQRRVFDSLRNALEGVDIISGERIRQLRHFTDAAGNAHTVQGPLEAVVDSAAAALKLLGRSGGLGTLDKEHPGEQLEPGTLERAMNILMALAEHSSSMQRVWNAVVWWKSAVMVTPDCQRYAVDDTASDLAVRAAIDLARRPALMARAIQNFRDGDAEIASASVLLPYVRLHGGRLTVQALPAFLVPDDQRKILLEARRVHGILQDATLERFIGALHPQVGLRIGEMMVIWGELAVMAGQLHALAAQPDGAKDGHRLSTIVESRLPRSELVQAIRQCVVLSSDKVEECIDFLCFVPSRSATLWDKPLLAAGDDVALLWWPLQGAHHARLLNAWAKDHAALATAFEDKGSANENIVAEAIRGAIAKSPYRDHMRYIGSALSPRHKPDEDIDILIVIDDTAFVIETASIPSPAEAHEFYQTERRLDQKAAQCRAQSAALKRDLDQIAEWANDAGYRDKVTKVFSLVIVNSYLRDGVYSDEVCYCHWDTLINVLSGGMYFGVTRGREEVTLKAPIQTGPEGDVARGVIAALQKSPKAEFYTRCVVPVEERLKGFDDTDIEGHYLAVKIDIPVQEELEKRLRECSFAATLEEVDDPRFD